jgi:hypothetical protein
VIRNRRAVLTAASGSPGGRSPWMAGRSSDRGYTLANLFLRAAMGLAATTSRGASTDSSRATLDMNVLMTTAAPARLPRRGRGRNRRLPFASATPRGLHDDSPGRDPRLMESPRTRRGPGRSGAETTVGPEACRRGRWFGPGAIPADGRVTRPGREQAPRPANRCRRERGRRRGFRWDDRRAWLPEVEATRPYAENTIQRIVTLAGGAVPARAITALRPRPLHTPAVIAGVRLVELSLGPIRQPRRVVLPRAVLLVIACPCARHLDAGPIVSGIARPHVSACRQGGAHPRRPICAAGRRVHKTGTHRRPGGNGRRSA